MEAITFEENEKNIFLVLNLQIQTIRLLCDAFVTIKWLPGTYLEHCIPKSLSLKEEEEAVTSGLLLAIKIIKKLLIGHVSPWNQVGFQRQSYNVGSIFLSLL